LTIPFQLENGQIVEVSVQGLMGDYVVSGAPIRPLGQGAAITPAGTGGRTGIQDQRVAATFVWYPQPLGFQAEYQVGRGPGLSDDQTVVDDRSLDGGYVLAMFRHDTCSKWGILTPYARYQQYRGGYRNLANAPYGRHRQVDLGIEWQLRKELELVMEYNIINTINFTANNAANTLSYGDFDGTALRLQLQFNY
jgi:hypothetical protein